MRLYSLRRHYGLAWRNKYPPIPWRVIVDALLLMALMFSAYALVEYVTKNAALSDRAVVAERKQMQAEVALAHCLNGGSLDAGSDGWIMCEKAYWVKL